MLSSLPEHDKESSQVKASTNLHSKTTSPTTASNWIQLPLTSSPLSSLSTEQLQAYLRYYPNPYLLGLVALPSTDISKIVTPETLTEVLNKCVPRDPHTHELKSTHKYDMYTGDAGLAALFYHLHQIDPGLEWNHRSALSISQTYIEFALSLARRDMYHRSTKAVGFLCTPTGPFLLASKLYHHLNLLECSEQCLQEWHHWILHTAPQCTFMELLYGHAGLLYASLYSHSSIQDLIHYLIQQYENAEFHGKKYLGAAHGKIGILTLLILTRLNENVSEEWIKKELDSLIQYKYRTLQPSTSSSPLNTQHTMESNTQEELVQWCHGVVGFGLLFVEAYKAMPNYSKYLEEAIQCGHLVFEKGILKKHVGLCHGIAGNAYLFLSLYQVTLDPVWLQRCLAFVHIALNWNHGNCDHSNSLYEGWGGLAYLMADLLSLSKRGKEFDLKEDHWIGFPGFTDVKGF